MKEKIVIGGEELELCIKYIHSTLSRGLEKFGEEFEQHRSSYRNYKSENSRFI